MRPYMLCALGATLWANNAIADVYVVETNDKEWTLRVQIVEAADSRNPQKVISTSPVLSTGLLYQARIEAVLAERPERSCPDEVVFDADMPAHYHGMVTSTVSHRTSSKSCNFQVDGIFFQMAGDWDLKVDVRRGRITTRAVIPVVITKN